MIDVEMTDDVRKYETKPVLKIFTIRQGICVGAGVGVGLLIGSLLPIKDITFKLIAIALIAIPIAMCGFVQLNGNYFEFVLLRFIYLKFLTPQKRKNKQKNLVKLKIQEIRKVEENEKLKNLTQSQKKNYYKKKNAVKYSSKPEYKIYT